MPCPLSCYRTDSMGKSDLDYTFVLKTTVWRLMWQMCVHICSLEKSAEFCGLCAKAMVQFNKMSPRKQGGSWMTKVGQSHQATTGLPVREWELCIPHSSCGHNHCQGLSVIWLGPTKMLIKWTEKYYSISCVTLPGAGQKAVKYLFPLNTEVPAQT